jgi:stage III sporulation protein AA
MLNTLIISPPGAGKTTLVRDICRVVSRAANVLIIDERGEISGEAEGGFSFDIGNSDVMLYCKKQFGFLNGIRSMRPDVIACDELKGQHDIASIEEALYCGVGVIATMHAEDIGDVTRKQGLNTLIESRAFKRYVVLSDKPGPGSLKRIYDENLEVVV